MAGDFNDEPDRSAALTEALTTGEWADLAQLQSYKSDPPAAPGPTFVTESGSSRIDQLYAPDQADAVWTHEPQHDIFDRNPNARELDHEPLQISLQPQGPAGPPQLPTINEAIYDNPAFNNKLAAAIADITSKHSPETTGLWFKTWNDIKTTVRKMSLLLLFLCGPQLVHEIRRGSRFRAIRVREARGVFRGPI